MIITEILARNARMYGDEIALIEREPAKNRRVAITWSEFDEMANRIANALRKRGVKKGDKVIHLMMNCLEWLPAYFGILKTGAWAVPLNFRFSADDIRYCSDIAEAKVLIFGEEFVERIDAIKKDLGTIHDFVFIGPDELRPDYAESFDAFLET
ncbi:MAG: acyl--CoA ligase, partial [Deltaproteobacteria bacterium]|nr:acyl--CoA ligase [Deltaproteobacteria bacterium]